MIINMPRFLKKKQVKKMLFVALKNKYILNII